MSVADLLDGVTDELRSWTRHEQLTKLLYSRYPDAKHLLPPIHRGQLCSQGSYMVTSKAIFSRLCSNKSHVTSAILVGFSSFASGETIPPTKIDPTWIPSGLYAACKLCTRLRCAVFTNESENSSGTGSMCNKPPVTKREGFACGELFARAWNLGIAHWATV